MTQVQGASSASYAIQWQYLQSLQISQTSGAAEQGSGASASQAFDPLAGLGGDLQSPMSGGAFPPFNLDNMSALINAQEQSGGLSPQQQKVFGQLDANGDGSVTGAELQNAFGADNKAAADYVMSKLDTDGDGSISQSEFAAGTTKGAGGHHHHHMHAPSSDASQGTQGAQDPLSQLLAANGASSQTASNSDGSTTTTITYSDGSKVSMTSAAAASGTDGSGDNSVQQQTQANLLQQLIKMQAQLTQSTSSTAVATV